jgi:hypothetical protein
MRHTDDGPDATAGAGALRGAAGLVPAAAAEAEAAAAGTGAAEDLASAEDIIEDLCTHRKGWSTGSVSKKAQLSAYRSRPLSPSPQVLAERLRVQQWGKQAPL